MTKINALQNQIDRLAARVAELDRIGPEPEIGTVFSLEVEHPDGSETIYEYIFFRAGNGQWYTTGQYVQGPLSWDGVVEWMLRDDVLIVGASEASEWATVEAWIDPSLDA